MGFWRASLVGGFGQWGVFIEKVVCTMDIRYKSHSDNATSTDAVRDAIDLLAPIELSVAIELSTAVEQLVH